MSGVQIESGVNISMEAIGGVPPGPPPITREWISFSLAGDGEETTSVPQLASHRIMTLPRIIVVGLDTRLVVQLTLKSGV